MIQILRTFFPKPNTSPSLFHFFLNFNLFPLLYFNVYVYCEYSQVKQFRESELIVQRGSNRNTLVLLHAI